MVVVDEAGRHAMEEVDRRRTRGIIVMLVIVLDPPGVGNVKPMLETVKESRFGKRGPAVSGTSARISRHWRSKPRRGLLDRKTNDHRPRGVGGYG